MTECVESRKLIETLVEGGEPSAELEAHAGRCPVCSELHDIHLRLSGIDLLATAEPTDTEMLELRRSVLRKLRGQASTGWSFGNLGSLFTRPAFAAGLAAVLLVAGFVVGMGGPRGMFSQPAPRESLTQGIELAASQNRQLVQTENSPYVYSNVQVHELDDEMIALSFDVSTHLDLIRPKDDPVVTEILVQSLVNPSPLDTRLEAISLAPALEPKVRDALIATLLDDENLAVRLKALEKLATNPSDPEIQAALLDVLKREESVQLRLLAIDNLTEGRVAPDALTAALAAGSPEPGTAIATRAKTYLAKF